MGAADVAVLFDIRAVLGGEFALSICRDDGSLDFHQLVEEFAFPEVSCLELPLLLFRAAAKEVAIHRFLAFVVDGQWWFLVEVTLLGPFTVSIPAGEYRRFPGIVEPG